MKYSTNFASDENPLSESGSWIQGATTGLDWTNVRALSGFAYGTQVGNSSPPYDDSVACLAGTWGWHQRARGKLQINNQVTGNGTTVPFIEAELLIHWTITAHSITGYELTIANDATDYYCQINRWNGALSDFTLLAGITLASGAGTGTRPATGDVWEFRDEGTSSVPVLTVYQNGIKLSGLTYSTSPDGTKYTGGSPGVGFYDAMDDAPNAFQDYVQWQQFDASDDYFDGEIIQSASNAPSTTATSTTQAFSSNVRQGDLLVAVGWHGGTVAGSFSDTRGNSWSVIGGVTNATDGHRLDIGIAVSKDAGASTVTYTHSGDASTTFRACGVAEVKSAFGTDKSGSATGNSATASSGASGTTTAAFELLLGTFGGSNVGTTTPLSTTNFNTVTNAIGGPSSRWLLSLLSRLTYVTGTFTSTASIDSQQWSALVNTLSLIATQTLLSYRFRNDDGSETTATWMALEANEVVVEVGKPFRLRIQIDTTGDEPTQPLTLQYRRIGTSNWTTVSTVTSIQLSLSSNIAAAAATATTAQLSAPSGKTVSSFTAGRISDDTNPIASVDIALDNYTEFEFCLVTSNSPTPGERYEFQMAGTAMSNTVTPKVTLKPILASAVPIAIRMS